MAQNKYSEIIQEGRILILRINNPPHNFLPTGFFRELESAQSLVLSPAIDAVVITGKGQVFSKGVDLEEIKSSQQWSLEATLQVNDLFTFISRFTKPVIAAINGFCLGGGLELALACHIRVCSDKARLGLPEVSIGLIPGLGGIHRMVRVLGEPKALEMILLGDIISASRAFELNLVSRIFPRKDFEAHVISFVKTLLATRKEALEEVLKLIPLLRPENEEEHLLKMTESFMRLLSKPGSP